MIKFTVRIKENQRFEIYMVVDNDQATTHLVFEGELKETNEKLYDLYKAIPFAIFKFEDGDEIDMSKRDKETTSRLCMKYTLDIGFYIHTWLKLGIKGYRFDDFIEDIKEEIREELREDGYDGEIEFVEKW